MSLIRLEQFEGVRVISYPDDSYVILSSDCRTNLLNKFSFVIEFHLHWLGEIGMYCNIKKSEAMILFEHDGPLIGPGRNQVKAGQSMNVLGFTFDCDLKWRLQTENVIQKNIKGSVWLKAHSTSLESARIF